MTKERAAKLLRMYSVNDLGEAELTTWWSGIKEEMEEALNLAITSLMCSSFSDADCKRDAEKLEEIFGKDRVTCGLNTLLLFRIAVKFDNGFEASIISGYGAHGDKDAPYELAVFYEGELDYTNPVTLGDVVGYLTIDEVIEKCKTIRTFERRNI